MITRIHELLNALGITANYTGFCYVSLAVAMAMEDMERLSLVTKRLYPAVARRYNTTASCVERNIRTVVRVAWMNNPGLLKKLSKGGSCGKPTSAQFISILTIYLLQEQETASYQREHHTPSISYF